MTKKIAKKMMTLLALALLNHWASPNIEAAGEAINSAQDLSIEVFDGRVWRARRGLRFNVDSLSANWYATPRLVINRTPGPQISFSGEWINTGEKPVRVMPTRAEVVGLPITFPVREVLDVTYPPGNPEAVRLPGGETTRRAYNIHLSGPNEVVTRALRLSLREGSNLYCTVFLKLGRRMGRIVLPLVKLRILL